MFACVSVCLFSSDENKASFLIANFRLCVCVCVGGGGVEVERKSWGGGGGGGGL